jgi:hypothetical protein
MTEPTLPTPPESTSLPTPWAGFPWARIAAVVWLLVCLVVGLDFITATSFASYGGDAYTGIQNAVARSTNALGYVIIGTGVIGFVVSFRRN